MKTSRLALAALALGACIEEDLDEVVDTSEASLVTTPNAKFSDLETTRLEIFGLQALSMARGLGRYIGNPPPVRQQPVFLIFAQHNCWTFDASLFQRPLSDFDKLLFSSDPAVRSVRNQYLENSHGRFAITRAGTAASCVPVGNSFTGEDAMTWALGHLNVDLGPWDKDGNNEITPNELTFVVLHNPWGWGGYNRLAGQGAGGSGHCAAPVGGKRVCGEVANLDSLSDFATFGHELAHSFGAHDMYGYGMHEGVGLMGPTISSTGGTMGAIHFDPWHKLQMGWLRPDLVDVASAPAGSKDLFCGQSDRAELDGAILFWDSRRDATEYFLLEARCRAGYDDSVGDEGLGLWHVRQDWLKRLMRESRLFPAQIAGCTPVGTSSLCVNVPTVCLTDASNPGGTNDSVCRTSRLLHRRDNGGDGWAFMRRKDGSVGPTRFRVAHELIENGKLVGFRVDFTSQTNPPPYPPLGAPFELSGEALSTSQVMISWKVNGLPADSFEIEKGAMHTLVGTAGREARSAIVGSLPAGTKLGFRVCARRNDTGERVCSSEVVVTTQSATPPPAPTPDYDYCPPGKFLCANGCQPPNKCQVLQ